MPSTRLTRIERRLMEAEYLVDSTNTHVRRKGCEDVKPLSLARYSDALNALRSALSLVRNEQGVRHPTLFAGSGNNAKSVAAGKDRGQKQKAWGSHTAHGWGKDCEAEPGEVDVEMADVLEGLGLPRKLAGLVFR